MNVTLLEQNMQYVRNCTRVEKDDTMQLITQHFEGVMYYTLELHDRQDCAMTLQVKMSQIENKSGPTVL